MVIPVVFRQRLTQDAAGVKRPASNIGLATAGQLKAFAEPLLSSQHI